MRDAQLWQQAGDLFEQLLTLPTSQRSAFLNQLGCERPTLLQQVRQILALYDGDDSFLTEEPLRLEALAERFCLAPEQRLGPYRIVAELGRGGMATVYLAERADQQFDKRVAIKVVRTPAHELLRRFRTERQILATLDHPRIARLIDAGQSEQGLPYLVMDYIEGLPIDRYCQQKHLGIRARLELFLGVCEAVQHAHRKLVVHRDLKPSNILVNAEGEASLLDFGIARLLQPEAISPAEGSAMTRTQVRALTPRYASPEQIRGEVVSTASDVYSLGVLLYELLSGQPPYAQSESTAQLEQWICQKEPVAPSRVVGERRLQRQLRGDLDTIVLMALRKEPERRYGSVERLAEDIRRHLAGLPVTARKDTLTYRTDKFIRRHRVGVVAGMLVAVAVGVGVVSTAEQARVAEGRFADVRNLANAFLFEFDEAIRDVPGTTQARQLLVSKALEYLDRLGRQSGGDRTLQAEIAAAYEKVGEVQGRPNYSNLGDTAAAIRSYYRALAIRDQLLAAEPTNLQYKRDLAQNLAPLAETLAIGSNTLEAEASYRRMLNIQKQLVQAEPDNPKDRFALMKGYYGMGFFMNESRGNLLEARTYTYKGLLLAQEWYRKSPQESKALSILAALNFSMAEIEEKIESPNSYQKALTYYRRSQQLTQQRLQSEPENGSLKYNLSISYQRIGNLLSKLGHLEESLKNLTRALVIRQRLAAADPKDRWIRRTLVEIQCSLGNLWGLMGNFGRAEQYYQQGLLLNEKLIAADPINTMLKLSLAENSNDFGMLLVEQNRLAKGLRLLEKARSLADRLKAEHSDDIQMRLLSADIYHAYSSAVLKAGKPEKALMYLQKELFLNEKEARAHPEHGRIKRKLPAFYSALAKSHLALGSLPATPAHKRRLHRQEAQAWYGRTVESYRRLQRNNPLTQAEKRDLQEALGKLSVTAGRQSGS